MKDQEYLKFKKDLIVSLLLVLVIGIPFLLFIIKPTSKSITKKLNNKETFILLITKNDEKDCDMAKKTLKQNNIKYFELNKDKQKNYEEILSRLQINNKKEDFPIIVYIKEGKNYGSLFHISESKEIEEFLKFHKLN